MSDVTPFVRWPETLAPATVSVNPRGGVFVGPATQTQQRQRSQTDAGYWTVELQGVPVGGPARVQAYRAMMSRLRGGATECLVPVFDHEQAPWPAAGGREANENADEAFSDGEVHSDGYGFYDPAIVVTLDGSHSLRATSVTVSVTTAGTIRAGMYFSLQSERLHVIDEVLSATEWAIWPPLRRDYVDGVRTEMQRPKLRCALAEPDSGTLPLRLGQYGYTTVQMVEAV